SFLGEEMYWVSPSPAKGASHGSIRQHEREQTREESAARARRQRRDAHTSTAPYLDLCDELYAAVFLNIGVSPWLTRVTVSGFMPNNHRVGAANSPKDDCVVPQLVNEPV